MKRTGFTITAIVVLLFGLLIILTQFGDNTVQSAQDIDTIDGEEALDLNDHDYLVYFWQEGCHYCEIIEDDIVQYANEGDLPIYLVDMNEQQNQSLWYDWQAHQDTYNEVVGEIVDGEEEYFVDIEEYLEDDSVDWGLEVTEDNEIVAINQTPDLNRSPDDSSELDIAGTPTLIRVENNNVVDYAFGDEESVELLEEN
ncbi:hypothetical protein SAMN05421734_101220 [Pelagirhabdus alkalitolerans]|uniref:Thioredoxin domain-containing protein n=1 Tax=Pelagirhabdus alkalitolerans TaxID=1612202 RepID=A0A1G6GKF6_9BACI|nr:hypothetical protein [Pelagirhabdus alkalitolerans]SDB82491.1 hypothetical protein SAMN05421734_101220 [Pelagirhabdus alkalitolerans]